MHDAFSVQRVVAIADVCLSDVRRYCIETAQPIVKLFTPCDSPIILVFCDVEIVSKC